MIFFFFFYLFCLTIKFFIKQFRPQNLVGREFPFSNRKPLFIYRILNVFSCFSTGYYVSLSFFISSSWLNQLWSSKFEYSYFYFLEAIPVFFGHHSPNIPGKCEKLVICVSPSFYNSFVHCYCLQCTHSSRVIFFKLWIICTFTGSQVTPFQEDIDEKPM